MDARTGESGQASAQLSLRALSGEYIGAFRSFLDGGGEAALERAYELGRLAIDGGLGVLDIAGIHENSLKKILNGARTPAEGARAAIAAEDFFAETLAPFEMAQRGYRQANFELRELTKTLEQKVEERTEQLRAKDRAIRQAYVDVFSAVTGGRLVIMGAEELEAALGRPVSASYPVNDYSELAGARTALRRIVAGESGIRSPENEIILVFSEALTNAVKHGCQGQWRVFKKAGTLQIMIEDNGSGIDFSILPKATLTAGFSTKPSLGMGFSIMLELCDRVLLSTHPKGTSIVLELRGRGRVGDVPDKTEMR